MLLRYLSRSVLSGLLLASPAWAQNEENVILRARDAFGERVGVEQVGLYSENEVRGFSITNTGSYRIDDYYYVREGFYLPDSVVAGVTTNVGISAARLSYPAPSGVVNYQLKTSSPGDRKLSVAGGIRDRVSPFIDYDFSMATEDGTLALAGGGIFHTRRNYSNKTGGAYYNVGFIPQWQPSPSVRLRGLYSYEISDFDTNIRFASTVDGPPPKLPERYFGPPWAEVKRTTLNAGIMAEADISSAWQFSGAVFQTENKYDPSNFTIITVDPNKLARARFLYTAEQQAKSLSGEATLSRKFETVSTEHTVSGSTRFRRSRFFTATPIVTDFAPAPIDNLTYPAEPMFQYNGQGTDFDVDQITGSLDYTGLYFDKLEIRAGLHRTRYEKGVTPANMASSVRLENKWLYNAALVYSLSNRTTVFLDTVKGLEETGSAPQNAVNRDEILPPVVTEQYEVGIRHALTPTLSLAGAVFDISKPTPELRPDGVYALIGKVRHRGVELSLAGQIADGTSIVLGAVAMRPRLSGQLVDQGLSGNKPVGVEPIVALASFNHRLKFAPAWSIDGRLTWSSSSPADTANTFKNTDSANFALGTRYRMSLGNKPALLRFAVSNLFTTRPWGTTSSGLYNQDGSRTFRLSLEVDLLG